MKSIAQAALALAMKCIPWDTVFVYVINYILDKFVNDAGNKELYSKVVKTMGHAGEALAVAENYLQDGVITKEEAQSASEMAKDMRLKLLSTWSNAEPSKEIEQVVKAENPVLAENLAKVAEMQKAVEFKAGND
ncbi:hypothetical protein EOL73_00125 [Candidatus Saccharibacteria bacterium]|nr:hypothetical protein [Candidatus Saccharibacteria bacterium]